MLKSRTSWIVGTVIRAATTAAITAVEISTAPAAVRRCQPVRRFRASTSGLSAKETSDAMASADKVRGIDRMNQTVIAKRATAIASGIALRGSRSRLSDSTDGSGFGSRGGGSERGRRHVGIVRADGRSGAHAPSAAVGAVRARHRLRSRADVLVPRDRARRGARDRLGIVGHGSSPRSCTRPSPGWRTSVSCRARSPCCSPRSCCSGAIGFVGYKIVNDVSDAMSSLQQAAPAARGRARAELRVLPRAEAEGARHQPGERDPRTPRGRWGARGDQVGGDPGGGVPRRDHPHDLLRALRDAAHRRRPEPDRERPSPAPASSS